MTNISSYLYLFIIGLSYGATACMFSCMPFLIPLLVGNSDNTKEGFLVIVPFSLGRVFSYSLLSAIAFSSSFWIKKVLDDRVIINTTLGSVTILIGIYIFYKSFKKNSSCKNSKFFIKDRGVFGFFAIGALMAVNPCAPLLTLIGVTINSDTLLEAIISGLCFGMGAILFSMFIYGVVFSKIISGTIQQFKKYKQHIERAMALFLIFFGIRILTGNITF